MLLSCLFLSENTVQTKTKLKMFLGTLRAEMNYLRNPAIFSCLALLSFKITGEGRACAEAECVGTVFEGELFPSRI